MEVIDENKIKKFYEDVDVVWQDDAWYRYSQQTIEKFIKTANLNINDYILNAGSGGSTYNLKNKMMHLDIAENKIKNFNNYFIGSIEKTSFEDKTFDTVICVGSVLNYVSATESIQEISRILKNEGNLILEFENSWGLEYLSTGAYKKDSKILALSYYGEKRRQWVYSYKYVENLILSNGFIIIRKSSFHIFSSLVFRLTQSEDISAKFDRFDKLLSKFPFWRRRSSNMIYHCIKKG